MRILYVTSYYKPAYVYGGPVRSISQMCEALAKLGAQVTVITTNANGAQTLDVPLGQPMDVDGVQVYYYPVLPIPPRSFFYSPVQVRACVEQIPHFDVVVLETLWTHPTHASVAACRSAHVPYVISLRGQLMRWPLAHKALKKRMYLALFARRYLDHAVALYCTDSAEAEATLALNLHSPVFVIPNGVDISRFSNLPARGTLRRRLGISECVMILLFLGRLHRKKRPDTAIEVLAALRSSNDNVHLILAGPDEERMEPRLLAHARQLGCADHVHVTGLLEGDEVLRTLADADLFLMPSEPASENFGLSAVEAMAAGVPVLVSDGIPVGRWAENAGAGVQSQSTAESFALAARELLSDPARLKAMGQRGRELVRQEFDIQVVARRMLDQLKAIIESDASLHGIEKLRKNGRAYRENAGSE